MAPVPTSYFAVKRWEIKKVISKKSVLINIELKRNVIRQSEKPRLKATGIQPDHGTLTLTQKQLSTLASLKKMNDH